MRHHSLYASGFTLVELMIVVAIIGLILAIAVPNYLSSSNTARTHMCFENLTQMEAAKELWALQNGKVNGDVPTDADLFGPQNYIRVKPVCPSGGVYALQPIGTSATCTIPGHALPQ